VEAIEQQRFYQDKSLVLSIALLLLALLALGLFALIVLLRSITAPPPVIFEASPLGQLIVEAPLDTPSIKTNELLNWVAQGMMLANTFNYINYPAVTEAAKVLYTKDGFESYLNALKSTELVNKVVQQKLILKAVPTDAPQLLLEKPFAGRYMWKIKIPMRFQYQNVTTDMSDEAEITLVVMRVPTTQAPNGVLILKYDLDLKGSG
jgi:intracellular multiplication protein IcmL